VAIRSGKVSSLLACVSIAVRLASRRSRG